MHDSNPGVVCLQETKLGNSVYNPGLNYTIYSMSPREDPHGGVSIIINKSIQHSNVPLNTDLQAIAVRATFEREITICNIYIPPRTRFTLNDINSLINQLPTPFLLLGDFNCHNPLWGGNFLDAKGRIIDDIIQTNDLNLYNNGAMTFHNVYTNDFSAIDLSLSSSAIHLDFNWEIDEYLHGSDHYPIYLKFAQNTPTQSLIKWKENEADWAKYEGGFDLSQEFESFDSNIACYEYFTGEMLRNAEVAIPKTKGKPSRPAVPWWNKTCGILRKISRKCYRRYKCNPSQTKKNYLPTRSC